MLNIMKMKGVQQQYNSLNCTFNSRYCRKVYKLYAFHIRLVIRPLYIRIAFEQNCNIVLNYWVFLQILHTINVLKIVNIITFCKKKFFPCKKERVLSVKNNCCIQLIHNIKFSLRQTHSFNSN